MSIEKCSRCDRMIDTDFDCEVYREDFDNEVICDACYDRIDADISEAYDRFYNHKLTGAKRPS